MAMLSFCLRGSSEPQALLGFPTTRLPRDSNTTPKLMVADSPEEIKELLRSVM